MTTESITPYGGPNGYGGKRKGAGRKSAGDDKMVTSSISLAKEDWGWLDGERGTESRSEVIRALVKKAKQAGWKFSNR